MRNFGFLKVDRTFSKDGWDKIFFDVIDKGDGIGVKVTVDFIAREVGKGFDGRSECAIVDFDVGSIDKSVVQINKSQRKGRHRAYKFELVIFLSAS